MTIQVKENPRDRGLVELHLRYDLEAFTEGNRKQLVRKIAVLLEVERESVNFEGMLSLCVIHTWYLRLCVPLFSIWTT